MKFRRQEVHSLDPEVAHGVGLKLAKELNATATLVKDAIGVKRKLADTEKRASSATQQLEEEKETTKRIRTERKQFYNLLRYQRNQTEELRERITKIGDVEVLKAEHAQLWEEFDQLREERDDLRAEIVEKDAEIERLRVGAETTIETKESSGDFTPKFRQLVYRHIGAKVPQNNISSLIHYTLEYAGKEPSSLPTVKTIRRMDSERLSIAQQHVAVSLCLNYITKPSCVPQGYNCAP